MSITARVHNTTTPTTSTHHTRSHHNHQKPTNSQTQQPSNFQSPKGTYKRAAATTTRHRCKTAGSWHRYKLISNCPPPPPPPPPDKKEQARPLNRTHPSIKRRREEEGGPRIKKSLLQGHTHHPRISQDHNEPRTAYAQASCPTPAGDRHRHGRCW